MRNSFIDNGNPKKGSIFLLVLTVLTVLFVLGFSMTFFTGAEEYSAAMTYESEVAFSLAESAVEEFTARLKNSLNNDDPGNQLYKVLRSAELDVSKEIPIASDEVAKLTIYTRETARLLYGMQFGQGLTDSNDFKVDAVLKLQNIKGVDISDSETQIYQLKEDKKEKQGNLTVTATVNYRGHKARVSLTFMIRVVKTFLPPFNYFTLFVRDASAFGGSNFNTSTTLGSNPKASLRLDNGWKSIEGKDFDPVADISWEKKLAIYGQEAYVPPGRVYLGQDLDTLNPAAPAVHVRATNGLKMLFKDSIDPTAPSSLRTKINARDNLYLNFDVWWMNLKTYTKKVMEMQGQNETSTSGGGLINWIQNIGDKTEVRVINIGAGELLTAAILNTPPSFVNCFTSLVEHTEATVKGIDQSSEYSAAEKERMKTLLPGPEYSGFAPFGAAVHTSPSTMPLDTGVDFKKLSPTLIYGPAMRKYFRAVQIRTKDSKNEINEIELPFIAIEHLQQLQALNPKVATDSILVASEAQMLFTLAKVPKGHVDKIVKNWEEIPEGLRRFDKYCEFMSGEGGEPINNGLGHFINRVKGVQGKYEGDLENYIGRFLESFPYPFGNIPKNMDIIIKSAPMREFYEGSLCYALPNDISTYLMDFYFIPRSTEDFFRGRTTVAIGGTSYDRFQFKYITDVSRYLSGSTEETLQLNGILTLNDSTLLNINNLKFKGHGVIYSSPMMGGGKVVINGDLIAVDTDLDSFEYAIGNNLLTIVAPQIIINTDQSKTSTCYVEANLISLSEPMKIIGQKPAIIKGSVVTPSLNLEKDFTNLNKLEGAENVIIYNPLNSIWRRKKPELMNSLYVAKIVTGGVGKFDWKYERPND